MRAKAECCEWTKEICAIKAGFRPWPDKNSMYVRSLYLFQG